MAIVRKIDLTLFSLLLGMTLLSSCASAAPPVVPGGDPVELRGDWRQGSVIFGKAAPGSTASFNGKPLRVSPEGLFLIGLDRDEGPKALVVVARPGVATFRREFEITKREYDIQRLDGLPEKMVTPPPAALARIEKDIARSRSARSRDTPRVDFAGTFMWPIVGRISGVFGSQRILNGKPKQPHYGVDVAVPVGTRVRAPASGVVSLAVTDMYYTGGTLMIDHGHGLTSTLMHLNKLLVKEGEEVTQGQVVAESGMTGRATGPHLDWRVSWFDARVDAQRLAGPMPEPSESAPKTGKP
jgi:murein DD-endopeptidase MepM/ murein hydrolase activator NlpD